MNWYLNGALTRFRNAVNAAYPTRDTRSDGTIGDPAHQATTSDHNPDPDGSVDAWDMDNNLGTTNDAAEIERLITVFQNHPSSRYWIYNRVIASRSNGWKREPYTGVSPHTEHVHWNTREAYEESNTPWIIGKDTDMLTNDDGVVVSRAVHNQEIYRTGVTFGGALNTLPAINAKLDSIIARVDTLTSRVNALTPAGNTDLESVRQALRDVLGSLNDPA